MEIFALILILFAFLVIVLGTTTNNNVPTYNYELIGTFTYHYNYLWDKEGSGYRTDVVAIFEDKANNLRKYEGSMLYANEWLRKWTWHDITTEQLIDFVKQYGISFKKNEKAEPKPTVTVSQITEDDCKLYYGHSYYYQDYTFFDEETNAFKMKESHRIDDKTYAELNFEDTLYIKIYKDGNYYSTDQKSWTKIDGQVYVRERMYLSISNELYDLFNKVRNEKYSEL